MRPFTFLLLAVLAVAIVTSASGASSSANVSVHVVFTLSAATSGPTVLPDGASVNVNGTTFLAGMAVGDPGPDPATVRARFELPPGLHWGSDVPDPSENCTGTPTTGECTVDVVHPSPTNAAVAWAWDIVADGPGSYSLKASIVSSTTSDPDTSDNVATATVVVEPTAPQVTAGAARVSPAKPRAGSTVVVRVSIAADGNAAQAADATCRAAIGTRRAATKVRTAPGVVTCTVRTPRSAHGKVLRGTMAFSVEGKQLTRRFSARLR